VAIFKDIYGVGKNFAATLYQRGARTIDDLRTNDYGLSPGQVMGVELYEDLLSRIPREEVAQLYDKIRTTALGIDPKLSVEPMGSYRRGDSSSGDLDILITRDPSADGITHARVLRQLVQSLHRQGVLTHDLSIPHDWYGLEAKWMGVGRVDASSKHRRIDILCIPHEQYGAALLYFTGNAHFNRSMRLYARKKGYSLNQRGLFRGVMRNRKGVKTTEGGCRSLKQPDPC
jgi:DNA polymerase lambda